MKALTIDVCNKQAYSSVCSHKVFITKTVSWFMSLLVGFAYYNMSDSNGSFLFFKLITLCFRKIFDLQQI